MSHFSRIKTQMVEQEYLLQALKDSGYTYEVGENLKIRGYGRNRDHVEIKISTKHRGYDIGFRKAGKVYECIADWYGIHSIKQQQFFRQVTQRYAYHATRAKLEEQGFSLVSEDVQEGDRIHLRLRRMA
jgi:hypothetical protein